MRVLIDLQSCQNQDEFRAIVRYDLLLVGDLLQTGSSNDFHLLVNGGHPESVPQFRSQFSRWVPPEKAHVFFPVEENHGRAAAWRCEVSARVLQFLVDSIGPDIVLIPIPSSRHWRKAAYFNPRRRGRGIVCLLNEMIFHEERPRSEPLSTVLGGSRRLSLGSQAAVLAVGSTGLESAVRHWGLEEKNALVIGGGFDRDGEEVRPDEDKELLRRLGITREFVLCCQAGQYPARHQWAVLKAWAMLEKGIGEDYQLAVSTGTAGLGLRNGRGREAMPVIVWSDSASDTELCALYRRSSLLVVDSVQESSGMPLL